MSDEKDKWNETEIELDAALCNFCNEMNDPIEDIELWDESIKSNFKQLRKAYNDWYEWRSMNEKVSVDNSPTADSDPSQG